MCTITKFVPTTLLAVIALSGCNAHTKTPEQIRQDAATTTAEVSKAATTAANDAKAAVQGVQDGIQTVKLVNINTASDADLETLPGIGASDAAKIIAGRPYNKSADLLDRHLVTQAEYDRISIRVFAN